RQLRLTTVAPCLPGGSEAGIRERGPCLFVAGVIDPASAAIAATELDTLAAAASALTPAYGNPAQLAGLVRARATFFGGACLVAADATSAPASVTEAAYSTPADFYATYHVPFFATWAPCERAALHAARGDHVGAAAVLAPLVTRAPHRGWVRAALERYR
ncbi:MAG: hypothetical protein M3680_06680, partial [Myxococcota bacterium]|nr:hypothetical protein [Myxococcota bacterium]